MPSTIKMGLEVIDVTCGFRGITVGRAEFILGCIQWLVQPRANAKGEKPAPSWVDEGELRIVEGGANVEKIDRELAAAPIPLPQMVTLW